MSHDLDRSYLILGLEPGASMEEVRLAYRDSVDAWHPDRFSHAPDRQQRAQSRLRQINDAYRHLQRAAAPEGRRPKDARCTTRQSPGDGDGAQPGSTRESAKSAPDGAEDTTRSSDYRRTTARPEGRSGSPAPSGGSWLQLTNENPVTVSALYFSGLGVLVAAGCGVTLGAVYGGAMGALGGLVASPLPGVTAGALCGVMASWLSRRVRSPHAHIIGGAVATLIPGVTLGALLVHGGSQLLTSMDPAPALHLVFGGTCGGALVATLGGWTGKAVAELMTGPSSHE